MPLSTKRWRVGRTQEGWSREGESHHHQLPPSPPPPSPPPLPLPPSPPPCLALFFTLSSSLLHLLYILSLSLSRYHPPVLFTSACVHFYQLLRTPGACAGGRVAVLRGTYVLTGCISRRTLCAGDTRCPLSFSLRVRGLLLAFSGMPRTLITATG